MFLIAAPYLHAAACGVVPSDGETAIQQTFDQAACTSIHMAPGTYSGSFVIGNSNVEIFGDSELTTRVNGNGASVFRIIGNNVSLSHLTIANGAAPFGGGVLARSGSVAACFARSFRPSALSTRKRSKKPGIRARRP